MRVSERIWKVRGRTEEAREPRTNRLGETVSPELSSVGEGGGGETNSSIGGEEVGLWVARTRGTERGDDQPISPPRRRERTKRDEFDPTRQNRTQQKGEREAHVEEELSRRTLGTLVGLQLRLRESIRRRLVLKS